MTTPIPSSTIGAVASVIGAHYYSHSKLNALFMESGAPGDAPEGSCVAKCMVWLKRCNETAGVDPLSVLGRVIQAYMDKTTDDLLPDIQKGQQKIHESLSINQLTYQLNGHITLAGASLATKTLSDYLRAGDFASITAEFDRALKHLNSDPHASITASCAIIEALCKTYISTFDLDLPNNQNVSQLWRKVQAHLGLNIDATLMGDQTQILQGLSSIVHGVGAYRTHIGSAHGRGIAPPTINIADARLAVNAAHSLVIFVMEVWHSEHGSQ